jgi:hypothetical protein
MSWVAAAIGTSAAVGAGGSIWSSMIQRDAAKDASAVQADASIRAENGLNMRLAQALGLTAPYRAIGENAGNTLSMLTVSPQERARQRALERAQLEGEVKRLTGGLDWSSFPILTGKNASERRAAMFSEQESARANELKRAQAALNTFDEQAKIETEFEAKGGTEPAKSPLFDMGMRNLERSLRAKGLSGSGAGIEAEARLNAFEGDAQYDRLFKLFGVGANASVNAAKSLHDFAGPIAETQIRKGDAEARGYLGAAEHTATGISRAGSAVNEAMATGLQYDMLKRLNASDSYGGGGYGPNGTWQLPGGGLVNMPT